MDNKKVLFFVEDENEIIELYSTQLETNGYSVEGFNSGGEALAKINSIVEGKFSPPAVIILDLLLKDISGLAILGELMDKPMFDETFIIVLTNYVSESLEKSVMRLDNVVYLSKVDTTPVSLAELIKRKVV